MSAPLRLGIAGLGTVGVGLIRILRQQAPLLNTRTGRAMMITAVSARDSSKDRGVPLKDYAWEDDAVALAKRDDVDVLVELIGGENGPAKEAIEMALSLGKDVVTANKALLAVHGQSLAEMAEAHGSVLRYEAAVAGGIPIVKSLMEGLAGNDITRVMGVMNGTCNYILTRMEQAGLSYEDAFAEADALGYVEADPTLDVGGIDAGHKLAILAALAFGTQVNFGGIALEGIDAISFEDIKAAADLGYRIKLLGVAEMTGRGLEQRMTPCLVPALSPLGQLEGGTNMVVAEGHAVGQIVLRGAGAGEGPTASAVMSDIIDIARGNRFPVFGQPADTLRNARTAQGSVPAPFYLRLHLEDKPGALAKVAGALGESGISIDRMRQYGHETTSAPVIIVTHRTTRAALVDAIARFSETKVVVDPPVALRIEAV